LLVSNELKTLKKEVHVIKVDVMKNQEILKSLAENDRCTVSSVDTRQTINRAIVCLTKERDRFAHVE